MKIRVPDFDGHDLKLGNALTLTLLQPDEIASIEIERRTLEGQRILSSPIHACLLEYDGYADAELIKARVSFSSREAAIAAIRTEGICVPFDLSLFFAAKAKNAALEILKALGCPRANGPKEPSPVA
jgi:hypothetical protein